MFEKISLTVKERRAKKSLKEYIESLDTMAQNVEQFPHFKTLYELKAKSKEPPKVEIPQELLEEGMKAEKEFVEATRKLAEAYKKLSKTIFGE